MARLAIKDELNSNEHLTFFDVDDKRFITVQHTDAGRVEEIRFVYSADGEVFARFLPSRIIYIDQLIDEYEDADKDFRAIDLDYLAYMEDAFTEVLNAA